MSNLVKYGEWDEDAQKADAEVVSDRGTYLEIKPGKNYVRFLPPRLGARSPVIKTFQHFVKMIPGDNESLVRVNCPRRMANKSCPLCDDHFRLKSSKSKADQKRAHEFKAKLRTYWAVIDRKDEDKGIQILAAGFMLYKELTHRVKEDVGNFTRPGPDGYDVIITKTGSGQFNTEYKAAAARKESALHDDDELMNEWLSNIPDLSTLAYVPTAAEIKQAMLRAEGMEDEAEDGGEASGSHRRPAGKSAGRGKAIETDGESVDDDGEVEWGDDD